MQFYFLTCVSSYKCLFFKPHSLLIPKTSYTTPQRQEHISVSHKGNDTFRVAICGCESGSERQYKGQREPEPVQTTSTLPSGRTDA